MSISAIQLVSISAFLYRGDTEDTEILIVFSALLLLLPRNKKMLAPLPQYYGAIQHFNFLAPRYIVDYCFNGITQWITLGGNSVNTMFTF